MRWTFWQKVRVGFWLLGFVPIILGVIAIRPALSLVRAADDIARTNEIVNELEKLLSSAKDLEVSQREYVLTADERHLASMDQARLSMDGSLKQLRSKGADRHWISLLEQIIPQKVEEVQETVRLRQTEGVAAASQSLLTTRGVQAMDDIRRSVNNMISLEEQNLRVRTEAQRASFFKTMAVFLSILLLNIALIWSLDYRLRREDSRIRALNEDLERRVEARTVDLQRSNEDLQQFAYAASHDLKEPMRMISSYSSLLQRRYSDKLDHDAKVYIGFLIDGVRRMNLLVTDLLEFSRAGEVASDALVEVDTEAVLNNVISDLKVAIDEAGASVTWEHLPPVVYDPMRLRQILQNLIANAIKYRGDRTPSIEIRCEHDKLETRFCVKDNGIGIDSEYFNDIFGIFKRLHGNKYEGTGIGLAMVKKIVERHGGRIWVESEVSAGSCFYFTIPLRATSELQTSKS
jgi:signal transduction histidine kinase